MKRNGIFTAQQTRHVDECAVTFSLTVYVLLLAMQDEKRVRRAGLVTRTAFGELLPPHEAASVTLLQQ